MIKKPSILCVDDEPEITGALSFLLEDDFHVYTSNNANEAMEIIKNNPQIKLVISDHRMPDMDGCTLLEKIKSINPDTYRIILSGYADAKELIPNINKRTVHKFIAKPWDPNILLTLLKEITKSN